jgi:hypothetical protein
MPIISTTKDKNRNSFPKLMISEDTQTIVLFNEEQIGVVVHPGTSTDYIGQVRETWDMDFFHDYNQPITLQNS